MSETVERDTLIEQLLTLGVVPTGVLVVHASFSKVGPVAGGPTGLIDALQTLLGSVGTLVMPSMADDDDHVFDPRHSPCRDMGVLADTFWRLPGVLRSDSPHAFAASGPKAAAITAPHPVSVPHGLDSPIGRVFELAGQVLLLGVGHDANTMIHLAENLARVRYHKRYSTAVLDAAGRPARVEYDEVDHCCENFSLMDSWLEPTAQQRRGPVGHALARLANARDLVATALLRIGENERVFLHAGAECAECSEARASMEP
jgi:aminoglycoside 3-N-acetyltransferase